MNISVFGGAQPRAGELAYEEAYRLGRMLAERGHVVINGGYMGTMEAVSRGAAEAGGRAIGVTCDEIEQWRPSGKNPWVSEERRQKTLLERLRVLIEHSDAAIGLPGGPGTLTEIALFWNTLIVRSSLQKPLILVGEGWESVFERFFEVFDRYVPASQRALLHFASSVDEAINILDGLSRKQLADP